MQKYPFIIKPRNKTPVWTKAVSDKDVNVLTKIGIFQNCHPNILFLLLVFLVKKKERKKRSLFSLFDARKVFILKSLNNICWLQLDNISPFFSLHHVLWDRSDSLSSLYFLTGLRDSGIQQSIALGLQFDGMNTNVAERRWHMSAALYRSCW